MSQRINIHLNLSGTIALADFIKVAALVEPDNFGVSLGNPEGAAAVEVVNVGSVSSAPTPTATISAAETATAPQSSTVSTGEVELDAAGVAWDPERHASTKSKTSAGLWRMKVGVSRPESEGVLASGNPGTGTSVATPSSTVNGTTAPEASAPSTASDEDDEFAAFRTATAAPTAPAVRNWSDGDLSKLCNQAAMKAGGPEGVKAIIAKFVPEGQLAHSRSIPADQRENFAKEVEATFGITYEG